MISKDKQYRTRDGREVRIYTTDAGGPFPVHGAIFYDGIWNGMKWTAHGTIYIGPNTYVHDEELIEVKPRIKSTVADMCNEQWMDIETAPKDGTVVLGWEPRASKWKIKFMTFQYVSGGNGHWTNALNTGAVAATHWMPLPLPPNVSRETQEWD